MFFLGVGTHAYIWHKDQNSMTDLKQHADGTSIAYGVSGDGKVVVGVSSSYNGDPEKAFIWYDDTHEIKMLGNGTLRTNGDGYSRAYAISDDGSTVIGSAETDSGESNAFIWHQGDQKLTGLGTLRDDNKGYSYGSGVSKDGTTAVGVSINNDGKVRGFIWHSGDKKMTDLGSLTGKSGESRAYAISGDGTVVVGSSTTSNGEGHATVWKVKQPSKPEQPSKPGQLPKPVITIVDATNSAVAMTKTGSRSFEVLDLYKRSIQQLAETRCQLGMEEYCLGAFSQYDTLTSNHRVATGVYGSMRLPVENIIIGGAVNFANKTWLTDNYAANGKSRPGVGAFIRYQQNRNNDGLSVDLSGAFLSQGVTITRERLENTEAGKGDSSIKGYQATLSAEYGVKVNEQFRVTPTVALTHRSIKRDGYTENRGAEFAATYGEVKERRTDLDFGLNTEVSVTPAVSVDTQAGAMVRLDSERDAFTGKIPYIGSFVQYGKHERNVEPYASVGVNIAATKNSVVRTSVAWQQTDYYNDAVSVGLSYSYHW